MNTIQILTKFITISILDKKILPKTIRSLMPLFIIVSISCVSVQLPPAKGTKSDNVKFETPQTPFVEIKSENADRAWLSQSTANTISYLSDCNNSQDPSLDQLMAESVSVLSKLKITNEEKIIYNAREAAKASVQGEVDGVPVHMDILIFKKNSCNYSLLYSGVINKVSEEKLQFENFLRSFKAP